LVLALVPALFLTAPEGTQPIDAEIVNRVYFPSSGGDSAPIEYVQRGEFLGRVAFWVAIGMLLFALVKYKTAKK
jgi:hypothetical protein